MNRIALWYQKAQYAKALKDTVNSLKIGYQVETLPESPIAALRQLAAKDFDIIQTDELLRYGSLVAIHKSISKTPFVCHIQGWGDYLNSHGEHSLFERIAIESMTRYCLREVDAVLIITRETKKRLQKRFHIPRWRYAKPLFNVHKYSTGSPDQEFSHPCLLTVTNLRYEEKFAGVITILHSLKDIFKTYNIKYRIAGGGRYLDKLRSFVKEYKYSNHVEVLGYRQDVPQLLTAADIFIYVSYLDSLAMTVLEAQAAGLPIIASDTGGIPEAVSEAGIVCPPDPSDLQRSIETLLQNPSLRKEFSDRARDRIRNYQRQQAVNHIELWETID
jgi:glycosyltransferase involved in cell wall biosynthesis